MITFRQKEYTILSGKYDGPKDMESVPGALSVMAKSTLAGAGIGGGIGYGLNKLSDTVDTGFLDGASTGGKIGFLSGIALKMLLNTLHNPMSKVKYQEVDKAIRRQFGILRVSGITVGDTIEKRGKLDEKYSFNDRNILDYKINITIQDNKFTMYLLGLSDQELGDLNKILDYYCKKYFGMNYTSSVLCNLKKENSYSVDIVFTNYQVISEFLSEVSDKLQTKINLLDNKAVVDVKTNEDLEKSFSDIPKIDKLEMTEIIGKSGLNSIHKFFKLGPLKGLSHFFMDALISSLEKLNTNELSKIQPVCKEDLGNKFLETSLNGSGLIKGIHYTVSESSSPLNIYLSKGTLIISTISQSPEGKKMDKVYEQNKKNFYNKNIINSGQVSVYTYGVTNKQGLSILLKKIIGTGIKPNIYVP